LPAAADITVDEAGLGEAERMLQTMREKSKKDLEEKGKLQDLLGPLSMQNHQNEIKVLPLHKHQTSTPPSGDDMIANARSRLEAIQNNEKMIIQLEAKIEAIKTKKRLRDGMYELAVGTQKSTNLSRPHQKFPHFYSEGSSSKNRRCFSRNVRLDF
jgi:hypothetical protein